MSFPPVAYAVPTPTWRATYRIVLPDRRGRGEALFQSWALVNNVSNEDWRDVRLTLVTGGPLSFAVDLTTPRFVAQPDVTGRLVEPVLAGAVVSEQTRAGRDGDAIADEVDECPDEPEDADGWEDDDGCPDHGHVVVMENRIEILDKVYFERESSEIGPRSRPILEAIAATLRSHTAIRRVEVAGHAAEGEHDPWGLSAARARAVRDALVESGIETERLETRAYGDTRPIAPAATEEGRARNRRAELRVLDAGLASAPAAEGAVRVASLERRRTRGGARA